MLRSSCSAVGRALVATMDDRPPLAPGPTDLAEIESRANAATPSPWEINAPNRWGPPDGFVTVVGGVGDSAVVVAREHEGRSLAVDCEFIAAARSDIPKLIAEVRRLQEQVELLQNAPCGQCHAEFDIE